MVSLKGFVTWNQREREGERGRRALLQDIRDLVTENQFPKGKEREGGEGEGIGWLHEGLSHRFPEGER